MNVGLFLTLLAASTVPAPDTLVVCPAEFRAALAPWEELRRDEGHQISVITPPGTAEELRAVVKQFAAPGRLKFVVLIGDVGDGSREQGAGSTESRAAGREPLPAPGSPLPAPGSPVPAPGSPVPAPGSPLPATVPIDYIDARINVRWGSEPTIATDQTFADLDGDRSPDVAVGRIPADTPAELAAVVRKIVRYEREASDGLWRRRVHVVAGVGGFGALVDTLVEAAARRVIAATVPASYDVQPTLASATSPCCPPPGQFTTCVCRQLSDGALVWIYLGHGLPTRLDAVDTPTGPRPILSVGDVVNVRCGAESPLAVLVACYTGALDAPRDCLAEELVTSEHGPVAVIAATRVTMPYGNAVFGHELLRACFRDRAATLGELWVLAGRRALADAADDPLRTSLDALARGLSPPAEEGVRHLFSNPSTTLPQRPDGKKVPDTLAAERREHVMMYQLLGDPLLRLRLPREMKLEASTDIAGSKTLIVAGECELPGTCMLELIQPGKVGRQAVVARQTQLAGVGPFRMELPLPADAEGQYTVRAFVTGHGASAAGATRVAIRQRDKIPVASSPGGRTVR